MAIAEVRELVKTYQMGTTEVRALRGINLSFQKGDVTFQALNHRRLSVRVVTQRM